jgi:O-antigen/teichoic acid export membrane protein
MLDSNLKSLLKNSSKIFTANIWTSGIALIQSIIVARLLGTRNYGLLALIMAYTTVVNQIVDVRISETVIKYTSEFWEKKDKEKSWATIKLCYLIDLSTGFFAFFLVIFTAHLATSYIIHDPEVSGFIILYAFTLLFSTTNGTSFGVLSVFNKFSWLSLHTLISSTVKFVLVILFLVGGFGLKGVLIGLVIASFINSSVISYLSFKIIKYSFRHNNISGKILLLRKRWKELFKFLLNTNFNELLTLFTKNIDILILGYFRTPVEVGYYRLAKNFVDSLPLISNPISTVIYPQLSKIWSSNKLSEFKVFIKKVTIFMSSITLPIALGIFITIPLIIKYTVGIDFIPSVISVRIMIWGILVSMIFLWIRPALLSMGRPGVLTAANAFNAVTMILFSLVAVPKFGYIGSSVLYVYPYVIGHLIAIWAFFKILNRNSE